MIDESRLNCWQGQEIFLLSITSRSVPGPAQPPIQRAPEALSPGLKRQGCEADDSPSRSVEAENGGAISPLHIMSSWRGD
jgi:hypothetical protein